MVLSQVERVSLPYSNESKQFIVSKEEKVGAFQRQYCEFYKARLETMKPRVLQAAKLQIGPNVIYKQLENVHRNEKVLVIGTIEKRMSARPSILRELAEEERILPADVEEDSGDVTSIISKFDFLEFEDEKQIVRLEGNISQDEVATGCTVGLYGSQANDDIFVVDKIVWPLAAPQRPWPKKAISDRPVYVVFLSGLQLTGDPSRDAPTTLAFTLLTRWLAQEMSMDPEDRKSAGYVDRMIIVGDSLHASQAADVSSCARYLTLNRQENASNAGALAAFDSLLSKVTNKMCVDVMGGVGDACTSLLPQQPIHRACLPLSGTNGKTLGLATNPYLFRLADIDFLAMSGQNVTDLRRMSSVFSTCDLLELLLKWQHVAPTAPDTVDAFPLKKRDAFVISSSVHVMVAGNQPDADSRWLEEDDEKAEGGKRRTLLMSIPRFSSVFTVTLLEMNTMEVSYKYFGHN